VEQSIIEVYQMKTSTLFEKHQLETIDNFKKSGQRKVSKCKSPQYGMVVYKTGMCHMLRTLERIKREVNILNSISSSYYPKNYDFLTYSNGAFEIIEEYIDSNSLNDSRYLFNTEANIVDLIVDMIEGLKILWEDVQNRMDNKKKGPHPSRKPNTPYLLTGLIWCSECDGAYVATVIPRDQAIQFILTLDDRLKYAQIRVFQRLALKLL